MMPTSVRLVSQSRQSERKIHANLLRLYCFEVRCMSKGTTSQDAPFGTLLGYAPGGVAIYSSDYSSLDPRDYDDDAAFRS